MIGHKTTLNKIRLKLYQTFPITMVWPKNSLQEENLKIHKYEEIKHVPEQTNVSKNKSKDKSENIMRQMKMETQLTKSYDRGVQTFFTKGHMQ